MSALTGWRNGSALMSPSRCDCTSLPSVTCAPSSLAMPPASVYTLSVQGGPMREAEASEFATGPYAEAACLVRRWDDAAKEPDALTPPFDHFRPLLAALAGARSS